jgi:hypothetical protein
MLCAFADETSTVTAQLVKAAVEELQWVEFSERLRVQNRHAESTGRFSAATDLTLGRLEILYRDQLVAEHRFGTGKTIIGRTPDNDVQIQSRFISRHHAQVVSDETQSVLEDLNSTNGVFIRAQRVKHQVLADGDIIQLGEHKLLYRDMRGMAGRRLVADDEDDDELDDLDDDESDDDDDELDGEEDADEVDEPEVGERRG